MSGATPSLSELYNLAEQLELDRELSVHSARERDHMIAGECPAQDDIGRLRYWLQTVSAQRREQTVRAERWLTERSSAALGRLLALFFGFSAMAAFLLSSGRGLVNVSAFLLLFVFAQLLLSLVAAVVMARTISGQQPATLPINPARLLVARLFPDRRYLRELQSVLRLVFLRYGQEMGLIFTLGAVAAFFLVLALSNFTFVWGSTFALSDTVVQGLTSLMATPWSALLPAATVNPELISASRYHPAISALTAATISDMRGWWPFLIMSMLSYAMLPRLLLWLLSRHFHGRQMRRAFLQLPGAERVLARMNAPLVTTQGAGGAPLTAPVSKARSVADPGVLLLNWANALAPEDVDRFEEFGVVADGNIVNAGLGSLPEELERLTVKFSGSIAHLCVAVKSWEPPMADLADFLANFSSVPRCTLYLIPLANRPVSTTRLADWQVFARALAFAPVAVQALEWK